MKFSAWYALVVGVLILAQWTVTLAAGQAPEIRTEPIRLAFHLAAEAATALALIISGLGLLRRARWGRTANLIALGMLAYTVIVSPGYFAQQSAWPLVGMFAVLLVLAVVSMWRLAHSVT